MQGSLHKLMVNTKVNSLLGVGVGVGVGWGGVGWGGVGWGGVGWGGVGGGGRGDLVSSMPECVCQKVKEMGHFSGSNE